MTNEAVVKPIYQKIAIDIANRIVRNEFALGSKIYGRSKLASEYKVSPETIRRSMKLLEDMEIVEVCPGSGVVVKSSDRALKFIEKFELMDSVNSIKEDISKLKKQRKEIEDSIDTAINKLINYSERFKNTNPFAPLEVKISENSRLIGKTITETNFWQNTGATIIGIRRNGEIILSPGPYATFNVGDHFILIGDESSFDRINEFLNEG